MDVPGLFQTISDVPNLWKRHHMVHNSLNIPLALYFGVSRPVALLRYYRVVVPGPDHFYFLV